MDWIDVIGHISAVLSSITFMPQVFKAWKTKSVGDLSLATMLIVFVSTLLWLLYGVGKNLWPVITCNSIICFLSVVLLYFKVTFTKKNSA
jgi:MtN3 and saliva related transmembrane protein